VLVVLGSASGGAGDPGREKQEVAGVVHAGGGAGSATLHLYPAGGAVHADPPAPGESAVCDLGGPAETGCDWVYPTGTAVTLTAIAPAGRTFGGWGRHECPDAGECRLDLTGGDTSVVATFSPLSLRVRASAPEATGVILSSPPGIACRRPGPEESCAHPFPAGTEVTLLADSAEGVTWGHGCTPIGDATTSRRCVAVVDRAEVIVGVLLGEGEPPFVPPFDVDQFLDVAVLGDGSGLVRGERIACRGRCQARYDYGAREVLEAIPDEGSDFAGWAEGVACGRRNPCQIRVGPVDSIAARFRRASGEQTTETSSARTATSPESSSPRLARIVAAFVRATRRGRLLSLRLTLSQPAVARARLLRGRKTLLDRPFLLATGTTTKRWRVPPRVRPGDARLAIVVHAPMGKPQFLTRKVRIPPPRG
jgi:hypothetical protein